MVIILLWSERVHGKSETRGAKSKTGDHEDYLSIQMRRPKSDEFKREKSPQAKHCDKATEKFPKDSPYSNCFCLKKYICISAKGCDCSDPTTCVECVPQSKWSGGRLF